jgi:hypothetical protein
MDNNQTEIEEMPPGAHRLPSGGWVLLSDTSAVNGRDVFNLRKGLDEDGTGSVGNAVLLAALGIRVMDWRIPGRPNLPLPRGNATWLQMVGWEDLLAMEKLVEDWTTRILFPGRFATKDDGQPGGPPAPDSE